jgi:ribosomal protein S18 acetylase RimI-like enzyme
MRIRPAQPDDATAIGSLTVHAYRAGGHLPEGHPYEQTLRDVLPRLAETLVAELDGYVIGAVTTCGPNGSAAELCREGEWEFRFLAVAPDQWSAGVGRALIAACEQRAWECNARAMVISVSDRNERGQMVYPGLGYLRMPERDWSPDGSGVRLLAYRKALSDPPAG